MKNLITKLTSKLGIDKAIGFTIVGRVVQGLGGVVSVLFIASYLTDVEQGFYYTFASLLAIQIFFELGLGGIITQYVAHENSHISWNADQSALGDPKYISRLASLLRFCFKWYAILALGLFVILVIVGVIFFSTYYQSAEPVSWGVPWLLLCVGTTLNFMVVPTSAFLEGLGRVKEIAKYRLYAQLLSLAIVWGGLFFGFKLYVGGISSIACALLFGCYVFFSYHKKTISYLYKVVVVEKVQYMAEIFPYQWKIALSWVSGYFIFQIFNPVLFATEGAVVAGQMGMTLAVLNAILALTQSWVNTKTPVFAGFIAKKEYAQLDSLFNRTMTQSTVINAFALVCFFVVIVVIRHIDINLGGKNLGDRFIPYLPMIFMMIPILLNHMINGMAIYLRCHKREPLLFMSVVLGVSSLLSTLILGKLYGLIGMTAGYMTLIIMTLFWTIKIFRHCKKTWHNE